MTPNPLLASSMLIEVVLCLGLLAICYRKGLLTRFSFVAALVAVWAIEVCVGFAVLFLRKRLGMSLQFAFDLYFYTYWIGNILGHMLMLCITYQIFRRAMAPFQGLRRLGTMLFSWVGGVSVVVTAAVAFAPRHADASWYFNAAGQFEQGISVLTICLLLFVCFASHFLGMTYRSHTFGLSLGLGLQGAAGLVQSAWFSTHASPSLYSNVYLLPVFGCIAILMIWGGYFMIPEAEQQLVLLPTTSPYFHWNQISEALGDSPGVVAIAGFTPEMLAPAEHAMLEATAQKMRAKANGPSLGIEAVSSEISAVAVPQ